MIQGGYDPFNDQKNNNNNQQQQYPDINTIHSNNQPHPGSNINQNYYNNNNQQFVPNNNNNNQGGYSQFGYSQNTNQNQNMGYQPPQNNVVTNTTPIIINNQGINNGPGFVFNDPNKFKTYSVTASCPSCKITSTTKITTSINCANLCCYICCDPLIWIIYQLVRGKDINCCDATHHCASCGGYIANYTSC